MIRWYERWIVRFFHFIMGYGMMIGGSFFVAKNFFFDGSVSEKVELGAGFLVAMIFIFFIILIVRKEIYKLKANKEIAHEVTKEMGKSSKSSSELWVVGFNWVKTVLPLAIIAWAEFLLQFYESSVYEVILTLLAPITCGYVFIGIAKALHQQYRINAEQREEDRFAQKVANSL